MTNPKSDLPASGALITDGAYGIKVRYDPELLDPGLVRQIIRGRYEEQEIKAIKNCLGEGERVLELGGGLGFVSTAISLSFKPRSYDVVEASPRMVAAIRDTHEINGVKGVEIHNVVATSEPETLRRGYADFMLARNFLGSSIFRHAKTTSSVRVAAIPLETLLRERKPTVLIADIEGGEMDLLTGISMPSVNLAVIEIHPKRIGLRGVKKVFEDFSRNNFVYDAAGSFRQVVTFRRLEGGEH